MTRLIEILAERKRKAAEAARKVSDNTEIHVVADAPRYEIPYEPIDEYDALGLF